MRIKRKLDPPRIAPKKRHENETLKNYLKCQKKIDLFNKRIKEEAKIYEMNLREKHSRDIESLIDQRSDEALYLSSGDRKFWQVSFKNFLYWLDSKLTTIDFTDDDSNFCNDIRLIKVSTSLEYYDSKCYPGDLLEFYVIFFNFYNSNPDNADEKDSIQIFCAETTKGTYWKAEDCRDLSEKTGIFWQWYRYCVSNMKNDTVRPSSRIGLRRYFESIEYSFSLSEDETNEAKSNKSDKNIRELNLIGSLIVDNFFKNPINFFYNNKD